MPITGAEIISASIDNTHKILTVVCTNAGEIQYPVSNILVRKTDSGDPFVPVDSIDTWSNLLVVGAFNMALSPGHWDVRLITSSNEIVDLVDAFEIAATGIGLNLKKFSFIRTAVLDTNLNPAPSGVLSGVAGDIEIFSQGRRVVTSVLAGIPKEVVFSKMISGAIPSTSLFFLYD